MGGLRVDVLEWREGKDLRQVMNWTMEVMLKIMAMVRGEAANFSLAYRGKYGPKQDVMVALQVTANMMKTASSRGVGGGPTEDMGEGGHDCGWVAAKGEPGTDRLSFSFPFSPSMILVVVGGRSASRCGASRRCGVR